MEKKTSKLTMRKEKGTPEENLKRTLFWGIGIGIGLILLDLLF